MLELKAFLTRLGDDGSQTLGILRLYEGPEKIFECKTLEPSNQGNLPDTSCIPDGRYQVTPRTTPKFGKHFWIKNVTDRQWILFHKGNFRADTHGCILVGNEFGDINGDKTIDLIGSKHALDRLLEAADGREFSLKIS